MGFTMVRPSQLLYPHREAVATRPAATVLLLRDGERGLEVLMTRRSTAASFAPGAYVFPGGAIDADDALAFNAAARRATQSDLQLTQAIAAIRECYEELGVLLARHADGRPADASDVAALDRHQPFVAQCRERGLTLAADDVFTLAHWTTDRDLPKRFDVPFLVARMPEGQIPVADETEQFEPLWVRPADALARHHAGSFLMIFPTIRTLERLRQHVEVREVLAACAGEKPLWTSCPRGGLLKGEEARYMEHEPPFGELQLVCPDGQLAHALDWRTDRPAPLLKNVMRLTAPNPGMMTGPGTNTYLVGDALSGYIVIDPGPDDAAHLQRIFLAAADEWGMGGHVKTIVCTHSHADHSPGAKPLQALCTRTKPAIFGLPSAPTARPNSRFTPDRPLVDGETLRVAGPSLAHTLKVVFTPGHAANHLCLVLLEDGLLFSGDHILNGSTTVIDPPDGDMTAYLESLDKLAAACAAHGIEFIAPAHGYVIGQAAQAIAHLKAHRLKREAKIIDVMRRHASDSMDDWVKYAYDDVSPSLWPVAHRSLLAHVERIHAKGLLVRAPRGGVPEKKV